MTTATNEKPHWVGNGVWERDPIFVGKDLGWVEHEPDDSAVAYYMRITGDTNPWYTSDDNPYGRPLLPPTFFYFQGFNHQGWFPENRYGTLFARQRWEWAKPLFVGTPIRTHAWVSAIEQKRERWHVTCTMDVYDEENVFALRTVTTQTFLVDTEFRGMVKSKSPAAPRTQPSGERRGLEGILPPDASELSPFERHVTEQMCVDFFGGARNYHTDRDESEKMGFDDIVVGGPMTVCYAGEYLTRTFGQHLLNGSWFEVKFIDVLWPDSTVRLRAFTGNSGTPEFGRVRYPLALAVEDNTGRPTALGTGGIVATQ